MCRGEMRGQNCMFEAAERSSTIVACNPIVSHFGYCSTRWYVRFFLQWLCRGIISLPWLFAYTYPVLKSHHLGLWNINKSSQPMDLWACVFKAEKPTRRIFEDWISDRSALWRLGRLDLYGALPDLGSDTGLPQRWKSKNMKHKHHKNRFQRLGA